MEKLEKAKYVISKFEMTKLEVAKNIQLEK